MGHRRSTLVLMCVDLIIICTVFLVAPNFHRSGVPVKGKIASDVGKFHFRIPSGLEPYVGLVGRPLYPYSIVPGGVGSPQELMNAMTNDPVVARHYAGFNMADARVIHLRGTRSAYVSYRIGDEVFWTKKPLILHDDETVITDGNLEARGRCGNRVSSVAQQPFSSKEPTPEVFESSESPNIPAAPDVAIELPLSFRPMPNLVPIESNPAAIEDNKITSPGIPFVGGGSSFVPPIPSGLFAVSSSSSPVPPSPPVATPEPGTGVLILLALSGGCFWGKYRKRVGASA
jgi:hypothetical protein